MFSYIAPGAKQYRANLHSHTNLSDGTLTPEQMVQAYQEKATPSWPSRTTRLPMTTRPFPRTISSC